MNTLCERDPKHWSEAYGVVYPERTLWFRNLALAQFAVGRTYAEGLSLEHGQSHRGYLWHGDGIWNPLYFDALGCLEHPDKLCVHYKAVNNMPYTPGEHRLLRDELLRRARELELSGRADLAERYRRTAEEHAR